MSYGHTGEGLIFIRTPKMGSYNVKFEVLNVKNEVPNVKNGVIQRQN